MYSVPLPESIPFVAVEPTAITDVAKPSYYSASFSPGAGYYVLNYQGPGIPWQKLVQAGNSSEDLFNQVISSKWLTVHLTGFDSYLARNERLTNVTMEYEAPTVVHSTIISDGHGSPVCYYSVEARRLITVLQNLMCKR